MHGGIADEEFKEGQLMSINANRNSHRESEYQAPEEERSDIMVSHIAGTIEVEEKDRLKKLLFRATRGKALTYFKEF